MVREIFVKFWDFGWEGKEGRGLETSILMMIKLCLLFRPAIVGGRCTAAPPSLPLRPSVRHGSMDGWSHIAHLLSSSHSPFSFPLAALWLDFLNEIWRAWEVFGIGKVEEGWKEGE